MKTICDFCKTEYTLDGFHRTPVKCAVCGHVWTPRTPLNTGAIIRFFVALCAFLAACIFAVAVIVNMSGDDKKKGPLVTTIDQKNVHLVADKDGNKQIFVSGDITNTTDDIYGLPNIVIISYDQDDNVVSREAFIPPVTLLEAKTTVTFNHILSVNPANVKRLSVELKETK